MEKNILFHSILNNDLLDFDTRLIKYAAAYF